MAKRRLITDEDLKGLPGLSRMAHQALVETQPRTVREALRIPGVGRRTTRHLVEHESLADPEGFQGSTCSLPIGFASKRCNPLTVEDLQGLPYLRRKARDALIALQPATAFEALFLRDVSWGIASLLLERGLLVDPERCLDDDFEFFWRLVVERGMVNVFRSR
jgi:hypothetical protein